ncbi:cytochrome P450 [Microbispora triticiradicis]|uniref:Cytochrome P450 n=3 Tax=Microbispora TaxID=2005 RepID=A0ABY3M5Z5_9ACTN|nr:MULTISPECIES: cytochrome P450 [Microbispora]RGA04210.1 cytochrome P450 [Microbispora triticiradicis]TLP66326.1 cytochrome P450 [Microbispora fusca]TYB68110.1 cytochrome P450 [Microbispora tritici]GLW23810.1 cytochrome P450 [Microbispora amethystogenes]
MTEATPRLSIFPLARERTFDPPDELTRRRAEAPLQRMMYGDGHEGWLATGYAESRAILADARFSSRPELMHSALPQRVELRRGPLPPGFFLQMDPPDHTRYRRLLTGQFTVRRMKQLEPRIHDITESRLDAMEREGAPADLVRSFALPIPSLVICEMLGVPYEDREKFQHDSSVILDLEASTDEITAARDDLLAYLGALVAAKRKDPGDDMLSGLTASGELTDAEIAGMGLLLLIAGHETTANMLGLGTFALLTNPRQLAVVRDDPGAVENAVEELLRYLSILHIGPTRTALEDVEIGGTLVRAGESVTLSLGAANRDPERFEGGDTLDVTRSAQGHLSFGHGIHQCLGQQLARVEMRIAYPALLRRFPGLRLAVPPEEVPMRATSAVYGVRRLPVLW